MMRNVIVGVRFRAFSIFAYRNGIELLLGCNMFNHDTHKDIAVIFSFQFGQRIICLQINKIKKRKQIVNFEEKKPSIWNFTLIS